MQRSKLHLLFLCVLVVGAMIAAGTHVTGGKLMAAQATQGQNGSTDANSHYDTTPNDHNLKPDSGNTTGPDNGQQPNNGVAPAQSGAAAGNDVSQPTTRQNADQDTPAVPDTQQPTAQSQAGSDTSRAGMPWGWIVGSFIIGLIVGGLIFNRPRSSGTMYRDRDDRDDFRRAA